MIDNLQELENKIHINKSVMDKIREKHKKQGVEEENYLTELQKAAFSEPDFWDASKHIIVQGRTSSGKTLVAQIAAAYYGMQESTEDTGGGWVLFIWYRFVQWSAKKEQNLFRYLKKL